MYIKLARSGFISVSIIEEKEQHLLPEIQFEYALLDFKDLHISKKVKKLINKDEYKLQINLQTKKVLEEIENFHEDSWLKGKYKDLLLDLKNSENNQFEILSFELIHKKTNTLVAGEVGYKISSTYTSLSGFSSREKTHKNCGNLQLVLLALYLEKNKFSFWNLGHPFMDYKTALGAKVYSRFDFLKRWLEDIN